MSFLDRLGQKLSRLVDDIAMPDPIRADLEQGQTALESGDLAEAALRFERATQAAPDYGRAWYLLGLCQMRRDLSLEAIASLTRALEEDGDDFAVLLALAEAHRARGDRAPAIDAYKRALLNKADERLLDRVYGGLGEVYLEQGETERAKRELRKAVAVSEGKDLRLVGLLGLAQRGDRDLSLARHSLSRAAAATPPDAAVLLGLVAVSLELGQVEEARLAALRLVEEQPESAPARCALARCQLATGDPRAAHQELLLALQADAESFEAHRLLALVHLQVGAHEAAIGQLRTALSQQIPSASEGTEARRQLLALQVAAGADPEPSEVQMLLSAAPDDGLGLACQGLLTGEPKLVDRSLAIGETYEARLAQANVMLAGDRPDALPQSATALRAALRLNPEGRLARQLLTEVYGRMASGTDQPEGQLAFYPALRRIRRVLMTEPPLTDLGTEVARIQEVFDRPLLLVVCGEFNSGKSTFVNALISEKIAPMGVTPTTATINVLKYGERRGARVIWRDDREEDLPWESVASFLKGLDNPRARQIRVVELLYPAEELLRVNIVDTPGLNSMIDEHEETAREFMTQADAVVWLFSADQAGKQTEQQALALLKQHRLKTVGVLNKVDRLSAQELEQVLAHLEREFSDLVEAVMPVAARAALDALVAKQGSNDALVQSRFPNLRRFLEQELFARSRRIKRDVCQRRLDNVFGEVQRRTQLILERADDAVARIDESRTELRQHRNDSRPLERERDQLRQDFERVYREGADEVLDFVRPRRWALGEHQATPADRDFLLELLMQGLGEMGATSAHRLSDHLVELGTELRRRLQAIFEGALSPLQMRLETLEQGVQEQLALLRQQVHGQYQAYVRGYLQGGRVDRFFERSLPKLKLQPDAIFDALIADSADLQTELLSPMAAWHQNALEELERQLTRLRTEVDLVRLEQDHRVLTPILEIKQRLETGDRTTEER